jgi:DNA-binding GntR family transcriptional regulator
MRTDPYEFLLNRILVGEFNPGMVLVEQDLARQLGTSRTPVREALLRLKLEGLVKIIPRGGIFVAEASVRLIREVTEVRLILEESLAHLVAERRADQWLKKFQGWLRETESVWDKLSPREWMTKDFEFHRLLDEAARNEVLSNHLWLLRRQAVLFWAQTTQGRASLKGIILDFKGVLKGSMEKDGKICAQALRRHVLDHVERIRKYLEAGSFPQGI